MTDHWGRLENENRRQRDQRNKEMMEDWRREKAAWRPIEKTPKRYPEVGDPPPGKIKFTVGMIGFVTVLIACLVMCSLVGFMFFRLFTPHGQL